MSLDEQTVMELDSSVRKGESPMAGRLRFVPIACSVADFVMGMAGAARRRPGPDFSCQDQTFRS